MMSTIRDSLWLRRITFVTGNLALLTLIIGSVILPPYTLFRDRDNVIEERRALLARLAAIVAQEENINKIILQSDAQEEGSDFLTGLNDSVINANLQAKLKAITETAGARLRTVQSVTSKVDGQLKLSGARIDIQGSLQSIHRAIYAIRNSRPFLFIAEAVIKPPISMGRELSQEPDIQAQIEVFAAIRIDGGSR